MEFDDLDKMHLDYEDGKHAASLLRVPRNYASLLLVLLLIQLEKIYMYIYGSDHLVLMRVYWLLGFGCKDKGLGMRV